MNTRGKYSGIITEIRNIIPQQNLTREESINIEKAIKQMSITSSTDPKIIYKEIYSSLDKILCYVRDLKYYENENIENMCSKIKRKPSQFLIDNKKFSSLSLSFIISFYEIIENKCYPFIVDYILDDYKKEIEDKFLLSSFYDYLENLDKKNQNLRNELHCVLKRIILRMLFANIEPNFSISDYLGNISYWNQEYLSDIELAINNFPKEFTFFNAVSLEKIFEEYKKKVEKPIIKISENKPNTQVLDKKSNKKKAKY